MSNKEKDLLKEKIKKSIQLSSQKLIEKKNSNTERESRGGLREAGRGRAWGAVDGPERERARSTERARVAAG